jgi:hypothetical protein
VEVVLLGELLVLLLTLEMELLVDLGVQEENPWMVEKELNHLVDYLLDMVMMRMIGMGEICLQVVVVQVELLVLCLRSMVLLQTQLVI